MILVPINVVTIAPRTGFLLFLTLQASSKTLKTYPLDAHAASYRLGPLITIINGPSYSQRL